MSADAGKNRGNFAVIDGGLASQRRTRSELELERAIRALFFAMCGKDGKSVNKNFRNVARGHTRPVRLLVRRLMEAKAARNDAHNYPLAKAAVHAMDEWVDQLFHSPTAPQGGERRPAA